MTFFKAYKNIMWSNILKAPEKLVYFYIVSRANETGTCHPSIKRISRELVLSPNTVRSAIKSLVEKGLIDRIPTTKKGGGTGAYLFMVFENKAKDMFG